MPKAVIFNMFSFIPILQVAAAPVKVFSPDQQINNFGLLIALMNLIKLIIKTIKTNYYSENTQMNIIRLHHRTCRLLTDKNTYIRTSSKL